MNINHSAYEVLQNRKLEDIASDAMLLKHKKSGARVVLISNDDENKTFYIGFRTPPKDSTGVAHIIEHSVLCGSDKYPVKDPFVELAKGSLNTFLNAMTFPDKTVYPVASCNDKDFRNLVDVYMDAVLHPSIYSKKQIFLQEGWHYELEDTEDELTINGVVYNEMKGVFSSPDDVLSREVFNALFPDTTYGVESGGDPDAIPDLSYEAFLEFHKSFYHPSNSYIYLYGNMDMQEYLSYLDTEYLSQYDAICVDSEIQDQPDFEGGKMRIIEKEYPIMDGDSKEDATFLTYASAVGSNLDPVLYQAFAILDYALCGCPGAPVKKALLEKGLCSDISSDFDRGVKQSYFTITASDANYEDKEEFIQTIQDVITEQIAAGIDRKALLAALNLYEFRYREADFGSYPKGLIYGLSLLDSWLYDDNAPFLHLEANKHFAYLRSQVETGYFEKLLEEKLLRSGRTAYVIMTPKEGLAEQKEKELTQKLSAYKQSLSASQLQEICETSRALKEYQSEPDSKEALATIPLLSRQDIGKSAKKLVNDLREEDGCDVLVHEIFTNGIAYIRFMFYAGNLPKEYLPYLGLLKNVLAYIDTEHFDYGDYNNEVNLRTGGLSVSNSVYSSANGDGYKPYIEVRLKAFYDCLPDAFELVKEAVMRSKFDDTKRLKEIISELKSQLQQMLISSGVSYAIGRAMSYCSEAALFSEMSEGLDFYHFVEELDRNFDSRKDDIVKGLYETAAILFRPENLMMDYTGEEKGYRLIPYLVAGFSQELHAEPCNAAKLKLTPERRNEAFCCVGKVQYVVSAGSFLGEDTPYTGALQVVKTLLSYGYLWTNVRVKGGAYGCFLNFQRTGYSMLASFRDPKLMETYEIYSKIPEYLRSFEADEDELTKGIIGSIADIDAPLTPKSEGARSLSAYMTGLSFEDIQKSRDEILNVSIEDIRRASVYLEKILSDDMKCVIGAESEIRKCEGEFLSVSNLL